MDATDTTERKIKPYLFEQILQIWLFNVEWKIGDKQCFLVQWSRKLYGRQKHRIKHSVFSPEEEFHYCQFVFRSGTSPLLVIGKASRNLGAETRFASQRNKHS